MSLPSVTADRLEFLRRCPTTPFSLVLLRKIALSSIEVFLMDEQAREGISEDLKCLRYNPENPAENTIWIDLDGKVTPTDQSNLPLLTVRLGDINTLRTSMNNEGELSEDNYDDGATANIVYQMPDTILSVEIETPRYDQALALAEGLMVHMIGLMPVMRALDKVRAVAPTGIIMPKKSPRMKEAWIASTGLRMHIDYAVTLREETLLMKKAEAEIQARAGQ